LIDSLHMQRAAVLRDDVVMYIDCAGAAGACSVGLHSIVARCVCVCRPCRREIIEPSLAVVAPNQTAAVASRDVFMYV